MALTKVLITVKTYPTLSAKYDELVCTAGFLEDGSWIRIYPIPYRFLTQANQYKKWQWITMDLIRNTKDFRPESYRPVDINKDIILEDVIDTKQGWGQRKQYALKRVYTNMDELILEAKNPLLRTSLAVVKPTEILDFIIKPTKRDWDKKKLATVMTNLSMPELFQEKESTTKIFQIAKKIPYKFSYVFKTEDNKKRTIMIEDWEVGMLYWNCLKQYGDEKIACQKVKEKFFDSFIKTDLHFFMGTTKKHHNVAPNPFVIIGTFTPPKEPKDDKQLSFNF